MEYRVVGCSACGKYQITIAQKAFRCKYCNKSLKLSDLQVRFASYSHSEALARLYKVQEEASK